jgi:isocitrate dehydrogenase
MTKDLAILISPDHSFLSTEQFMDAIGQTLQQRMG